MDITNIAIEIELAEGQGIFNGKASIAGAFGQRSVDMEIGPVLGESAAAYFAHILSELRRLRGVVPTTGSRSMDDHIRELITELDHVREQRDEVRSALNRWSRLPLSHDDRQRMSDVLNATDRQWCDYSLGLLTDKDGRWTIWLNALHTQSAYSPDSQFLDRGTYEAMNARLPFWLYELERQLGHIPTEEEGSR